MSARVGIVTRTKNRTVLLKRALRSVLDQSHTNWLQIVVNDGGDPSEVDALITDFSEESVGRVRVIHHANSLGMEAASNAGIRSILDEIDLLIIHDDDDSWAPDFLKVAIGELASAKQELPSIRGVITQANCVYEEIRGGQLIINELEPFLPWIDKGLISLDAMMHQCQFAPIQFLYEKSVIEEIGFYREELPVLGDWEFNIRFLRKYDIKIVPQYFAFYHHRRTTNDAFSNSVHGAKDRHDLYRQWLKNQWLKKDLDDGSTGLGYLTNARPMEEHLIQQVDRVLAIVSRLESGATKKKSGALLGLRLLRKTGRPFHYVGRFFHFLKRKGLKGALARTRFWLQIKSGQIK